MIKPILLVLGVLTLVGATGCQTGGPGPGNVTLAGTEWHLKELNGKAYVAGAGLRQPTLKFDPVKAQVNGISGVNRYFGGYELQGERLKFGQLGGTRMAGTPEAMELEHEFLKMLAQVNKWSIKGNQLELKQDRQMLATLTQPLP
jgi:heat shock protein HslJ